MADGLLKIYLQDHLAGSEAGIRLARLCQAQNLGTPVGAFAARLLRNLAADKVVLSEVLDRLHGDQAPLRRGLGAMAGLLSQLKLRRPGKARALARFETVEALVVAVNGRRALWRTLERVAESDRRMKDLPFGPLAQRAKDDLEEAEAHRLALVREAFEPVAMPRREGLRRLLPARNG